MDAPDTSTCSKDPAPNLTITEVIAGAQARLSESPQTDEELDDPSAVDTTAETPRGVPQKTSEAILTLREQILDCSVNKMRARAATVVSRSQQVRKIKDSMYDVAKQL